MLGYVGFVLLLVVPGVLVGLLSGDHRGRRFTEVLALSFGLSLIVVPLFLALLSSLDLGISGGSILGLLLVSVVGALLILWRRVRGLGRPEVSRIEVAAMALVPVQGFLFALQLLKYPIFPMILSADFSYHLEASLRLQTGDLAVTQVSYPPAVHLLIAAAMALQPGIPLSVMQHAVVIMGSLAPLLVFVVASRVFGDPKIGLVASLLYVFTGSAWYTWVFTAGLYANFFANLVTLAAILLIVTGLQELNHSRRILLFLAGAALYLSHYTVIIFVAVLWLALPVVWRRARGSLWNYGQMLALITVPGGALALLRPDAVAFLARIPSFAGGEAGRYIGGDDPISKLLPQVSPFLGFLFQEVGPGLLALTFGTIPLAVYWAVKRKELWTPLLLIWFFVIWVTTPYGEVAWRFSKYAVLPLTLLWPLALGGGLSSLFSRLAYTRLVRRRGMRPRREMVSRRTVKAAILMAVAAGILWSSALQAMIQDSSVERVRMSRYQDQVYDSMRWLSTNGDEGKVLGIGDWRFRYLKPIWGRDVTLEYGISAKDAYELARSQDYKYALVSDFLVQPPWSGVVMPYPHAATFQTFDGFNLEYSNTIVKVYSVKS